MSSGDKLAKAEQIAELLSAQLPAEIATSAFRGLSTLDSAAPEDVSFVAKPKFAKAAEESRAGLIVAPEDLELQRTDVLRVPNVMEALLKLLHFFHPAPDPVAYRHPLAVVAEDATVGEDVYIGPHAVIESGAEVADGARIEALTFVGQNARVGAGCWLSPRVTIMDETILGARVRIHSGTVVGADGFRFEGIGGRIEKIPQVGRVVIEDDVEIGANSTIDRASFTETRVGARTKIDNMVHIGHNCTIGSDCILVGQVGLGGSVKLGRGVVLGGRAGVRDNIEIGDGSRIGGASLVGTNLPPGSEVIGFPAMPVRDFTRYQNFQRNFGKHWKGLKKLLDSVQDEGTESS